MTVTLLNLFLLLGAVQVMAAQLPAGRAVTLDEFDSIIRMIARFLVVISVVFAVIAFVISGIYRMYAADDTKKLEKAKGMFKSAIWGTLIVLGVGVIINTLAGLVTREFFCQLSIFGICIW